jgi:hypothetical protein
MRSPRDRSIEAVARRERQDLDRTARDTQRLAVEQVRRWNRTYSLREIGLVLGVGTSTTHRWVTAQAWPALQLAQVLVDRADEYQKRLEHNAHATTRSNQR